VDDAVLHFIQETCIKGMLITLQAASVGNRNFQSLGIIHSKAGCGWCGTGNANEREAYFDMS
jgi:hypothetical protein